GQASGWWSTEDTRVRGHQCRLRRIQLVCKHVNPVLQHCGREQNRGRAGIKDAVAAANGAAAGTEWCVGKTYPWAEILLADVHGARVQPGACQGRIGIDGRGLRVVEEVIP